jgi:hypothetical protein
MPKGRPLVFYMRLQHIYCDGPACGSDDVAHGAYDVDITSA